MKTINDATWKDAAVIECRSLVARLETNADKLGREFAGEAERNPRMRKAIEEANSLTLPKPESAGIAPSAAPSQEP
jgi:hypothetical protein